MLSEQQGDALLKCWAKHFWLLNTTILSFALLNTFLHYPKEPVVLMGTDISFILRPSSGDLKCCRRWWCLPPIHQRLLLLSTILCPLTERERGREGGLFSSFCLFASCRAEVSNLFPGNLKETFFVRRGAVNHIQCGTISILRSFLTPMT